MPNIARTSKLLNTLRVGGGITLALLAGSVASAADEHGRGSRHDNSSHSSSSSSSSAHTNTHSSSPSAPASHSAPPPAHSSGRTAPATPPPAADNSGGRRFGSSSPAAPPSSDTSGGRRFGGRSGTDNNTPAAPQPEHRTYTPPAGNTQPAANSSPRNSGYSSSPYRTNNPGYNNSRPTTPYSGAPVQTHDGHQFSFRSNGRVESFRGPNNTEAHYRTDGSVHIVRTNNITITHGPVNVRQIVVQRPDRTVVVTNSAGHGYIQRPFVYGNHEFVHRTYYVAGVPYSRVYRPYSYRGIVFHSYVPAYYYRPAFYGWVYTPWATPVRYRWGWMGSPWYSYYGPYFSPYPVYSNAWLWLTDYLIASSLSAAYQARVDAANAQALNSGYSAAYGQPALTPEIKQAIADEVQQQLARERAEGQAAAYQSSAQMNGAPLEIGQLLSDGRAHTFVAANSLFVLVAGGGGECAITPGDVLQVAGRGSLDPAGIPVRVLASKGQDCRQGSTVMVSMQDLQEMQNQMHATVDQGLGDLHAHPGQGGLPAPPADALQGTVPASFASYVPPVDQNAATELRQQAQVAEQTESQVLREAAPPPSSQPLGPAPGAPPATVSLGQSIAEVESALGAPQQVMNLGAKQIYVYRSVKITFLNGKVTDVQ